VGHRLQGVLYKILGLKWQVKCNYKINLLETVKHNKYIGHRLQGVLYKILGLEW